MEMEKDFVAQQETLLAGRRCLVLDDEFLIALDIQQILEAAGAASVVSVSNAADAMAALHTGLNVDLAVLDVLLGSAGTSLALAAALVAQKTPFVFLTGMHGEDVHTRKFPSAPVVEKPYQPLLLLDAVLRALTAS